VAAAILPLTMLAGIRQMAADFTRMVAILLSLPMTVCGEDWWTTGENEDSIMKTKRTQIILATLSIALTLSAVSARADTHADDKDH
jgi:hypothetical protein